MDNLWYRATYLIPRTQLDKDCAVERKSLRCAVAVVPRACAEKPMEPVPDPRPRECHSHRSRVARSMLVRCGADLFVVSLIFYADGLQCLSSRPAPLGTSICSQSFPRHAVSQLPKKSPTIDLATTEHTITLMVLKSVPNQDIVQCKPFDQAAMPIIRPTTAHPYRDACIGIICQFIVPLLALLRAKG